MDLWRNNDRLSWRKLAVLVSQLPPESATATQLRVIADAPSGERDPESEQWSRVEHLLALVADEIRGVRWLTEAQLSHKKPSWELAPTSRPGIAPKRRKRPKLTPDQAQRLFDLIYAEGVDHA